MRIDDIVITERKLIKDDRGSFFRAFCDKELAHILNGRCIKQINISRTSKVGAIRGLHFQYPPFAEMKLIRCIAGKVWDVAVDLRKRSPSYLKWQAEELSEENGRMIIIPEGFAHGFQVLMPDSQLLYLHTAAYEPNAEGGVRYNDPVLSINWPLPVSDISPRDSNHPLINGLFGGFEQ